MCAAAGEQAAAHTPLPYLAQGPAREARPGVRAPTGPVRGWVPQPPSTSDEVLTASARLRLHCFRL